MMSARASASATLAALRRGDRAGTTELQLSGAGLTEFPRDIFGLADTLEVLDLSHNAITTLPDDFRRLHRLRVLFCSGNPVVRLPPVLGDCAALSQIGFRGCGVKEIPAEALPPALRWLTLTDNAIETLPPSLGRHSGLQKLMLAGNRLRHLPDSLAGLPNLELLRLSANQLTALPPWLAELPRLAWLAWAGNPFDHDTPPASATTVAWADLQLGPALGEGASGQVYRVMQGGQPMALKLFRGAMTSDGLPEREMAACLAAGRHPNLVSALGALSGHPEQVRGLLMPLLPADWRPLAGPPSLASCSRDVYDPALCFSLDVALRIVRGIGAASCHLHRNGILHGDLYAHNILWDGEAGECVLTDFGAASFLPPQQDRAAFAKIEVLAWGLLLGELLDRCADVPSACWTLQRACVQPALPQRPNLQDALAMLDDITPGRSATR